jgi:hypothetical protein
MGGRRRLGWAPPEIQRLGGEHGDTLFILFYFVLNSKAR